MVTIEIEVGQRWTHKLTSLAFTVALIEGDEILLEPEGEGSELTVSSELLMQEFLCPQLRRERIERNRQRKKKIKPGKIRRGLRR